MNESRPSMLQALLRVLWRALKAAWVGAMMVFTLTEAIGMA